MSAVVREKGYRMVKAKLVLPDKFRTDRDAGMLMPDYTVDYHR
jgi:hypothetical protein